MHKIISFPLLGLGLPFLSGRDPTNRIRGTKDNKEDIQIINRIIKWY